MYNAKAFLSAVVLAGTLAASVLACSATTDPETSETAEAPLAVEIPALPLFCSSQSIPACAGRVYGSPCAVGDGRVGKCDSPWKPVPWHQLNPPQISGWDCNTCVPIGAAPAPKKPAPHDVAAAAAE